MPEKKYSWLIDAEGTYARVEPAEVDTWKPLGWAPADEPSFAPAEQFAWMQHEQHQGRARFPLASVPHWAALGWHPAPPPAPLDLTKDPDLVDVKEEPASADVADKKTADKAKDAK